MSLSICEQSVLSRLPGFGGKALREFFLSKSPLYGPILFSTSRCHTGEGSQSLLFVLLPHYFRACPTPPCPQRKVFHHRKHLTGPCSSCQPCPSTAPGVPCPLTRSSCPWPVAAGQNPSSQWTAQLYKHPMMGLRRGCATPLGSLSRRSVLPAGGTVLSLPGGGGSALLHPAPSPIPALGISGLFAAAPMPGAGNPPPTVPSPALQGCWPGHTPVSQNPQAWKRPSNHQVQPQSPLNHIPTCHIQVALEHFHTTSLDNSSLCLTTLSVKQFCLIPDLNQMSRAEIISVLI